MTPNMKQINSTPMSVTVITPRLILITSFLILCKGDFFVMEKFDVMFQTAYYTICNASKYLFAIKLLLGIVKNLEHTDIKGTLQEFMNVGFSYAALFSITEMLDAIRDLFINQP